MGNIPHATCSPRPIIPMSASGCRHPPVSSPWSPLLHPLLPEAWLAPAQNTPGSPCPLLLSLAGSPARCGGGTMTPPPSPQGRCAPRTRRHLQAQRLRKGRCSIRRTPSHSPGPQVLRALRTGQCWTPWGRDPGPPGDTPHGAPRAGRGAWHCSPQEVAVLLHRKHSALMTEADHYFQIKSDLT